MNRRSFIRTAALALTALALPLPALGQPRETRTVEIFWDGKWVPIEWTDLKQGMVFRLRDPDGSIVDAGTKHEVSVAVGDATREPAPAYWGVKCEPFTNITKDHQLAGKVQIFNRKGEQIGLIQSLHMGGLSPQAWRRPTGGVIFEHTVPFHNVRVVFPEGSNFGALTQPV